MKTDIADRWIAELRSGKYEQGRCNLHRDNKFCCLGVLAAMVAEEAGISVEVSPITHEMMYDNKVSTLPKSVMKYTGIQSDIGYIGHGVYSLASMNDNGESFAGIADIIEAHKENL